MCPLPVLNKKQNYRLWQSGAFGNKLRAWRTVDEYYASGFAGVVALRALLKGGGGPCEYDLVRATVGLVAGMWCLQGVPLDAMMVNEQADDNAIVLQGEYLNGVVDLQHCDCLRYTTVQRPMREAFALETHHAEGLRARLMIREAMTPSSYEDWQVLLDQYPDHVLEVSIYSRCLGDIPGRNALVWEVRRY